MWWTYRHQCVLENGDKASIRVGLDDRTGIFSIEEICLIPKGKRKEIHLKQHLSDNYSYRRLSPGDRSKAELKMFVETVGEATVNEALLNAWESLKPNLISKEQYDIDY